MPALEVPSLGPQFQINDSLAICEYLAEAYPDLPLWPKDAALRTQARAAVAQMHSGLCTVLRASYPTNALAKYTGAIPLYDGAAREVGNCLKLWGESRRLTRARLAELGQEDSDEGFLFGQFGIADAFFWPVLWVGYPAPFFLLLISIIAVVSLTDLCVSVSDLIICLSPVLPQKLSSG